VPELLNGLVARAQEFALIVGTALAVIALAATVYAAKTAFGPLAAVMQWMFAYAPGERPSDVVAGISFGARMLAWSALVGAVVWLVYQWRFSS
jgi:hypothetical protein